ncbi:MAG: phosphoenolpyruvate carboxykinase [Chloroflexi bacterium]|nr:phosphoenolpyruvate carboxykinase [Chloroflexota bacterium]
MEPYSFDLTENKAIIRNRGRICETADELLSSDPFRKFVLRSIQSLQRHQSLLLGIFGDAPIDEESINLLIQTLRFLARMPARLIPGILPGSEIFLADRELFADFAEHLYKHWRSFDRFVICNSEGDALDQRPYRTFNDTVERLTHLVRGTFRDIDENISGSHPRIYRQVRAGAAMAAIALPHTIFPDTSPYCVLNQVPIIRQELLYPPLVLNPPMNKRTGRFSRVDCNPLAEVEFNDTEWLCYPAKVGELLILIYFQQHFFELGFSLCNLFEIAGDDDLRRRPDAVYAYGIPGDTLDSLGVFPTVFYDDEDHDLLVAAVPNRDEFGYFGYLKKMVLTLHNIRMMKLGHMPYHGAMVRITMQGRASTILIIGDTGAGKSETLEAFRMLSDEHLQDMTIIADDMGSLQIDEEGVVRGYGSEIGAFVRLDDLQPGYAFGQIDRTIIMSPSQINARAIVPVTNFANITRGYPVDLVLYANNYDPIDDEHPIVEQFHRPEDALAVFEAGAVMSKGTTTSTGLVHSYFANIFGPPQYRQLHDALAQRYFRALYACGAFVGQMRTRLGIPGCETTGPEQAAMALLDLLASR